MKKILHTNLYSDFAEKFIKHTTFAVTHNIGWGRTGRKFDSVEIVRQPNGEVVFYTDDWNTGSICCKFKTELEAKIWLARTIKYLTKLHADKHGEWKRDNPAANVAISDATVQQTYLVYDLLIERKRLEQKYPAELIAEVRGTERDELATELEAERRRQVAAIKEKWQKTLAEADPDGYGVVYDEINTKVAEFRKSVKEEYTRKYTELKRQRDAEIEAVNAAAKAALDATAFPFAC